MNRTSPLRFLIAALSLLVLVGCLPVASGPPAATPALTGAVPQLQPTGDPAEIKAVAQSYLDAWKVEDYPAMYGMLTSVSRDAMSAEEFSDHYSGVAVEAALNGIEYEILSVLTGPSDSQVRYRVTLDSRLVGKISRETVMNLRREKGEWRVEVGRYAGAAGAARRELPGDGPWRVRAFAGEYLRPATGARWWPRPMPLPWGCTRTRWTRLRPIKSLPPSLT